MDSNSAQMKLYMDEINFETRGELDWKDLSTLIADCLKKSAMKAGLAHIFVPGSTGSVVTIESESGLLTDLMRLAQEIIPKDRDYEHEKKWHDGNGHAHLRATLFGASITIPFSDGQPLLGAWQQPVFLEFDIRPRKRKLIIYCVGM